MNNCHQLYEEYQKIQKIIKSSYDLDQYDEDTKKWLTSKYKRSYNYRKQTYVSVESIREICQKWIDRVVEENKLNRFNRNRIDLFTFWVQGKYKERKRFLQLFFAIYYDMVGKLDELDGGLDQNENRTLRSAGFQL